MIIQLSIRLGISHREIETWDLPTIRQYICVLREITQHSKEPEAAEEAPPTDAQVMAAFERLRDFQGE